MSRLDVRFERPRLEAAVLIAGAVVTWESALILKPQRTLDLLVDSLTMRGHLAFRGERSVAVLTPVR